MILWKIEKPKNSKREIANSKTNQLTDQHPQFQEGTYEKVLIMLRINKPKVPSTSKRVAKVTKVTTTK